jgi:hypothetical protein
MSAGTGARLGRGRMVEPLQGRPQAAGTEARRCAKGGSRHDGWVDGSTQTSTAAARELATMTRGMAREHVSCTALVETGMGVLTQPLLRDGDPRSHTGCVGSP